MKFVSALSILLFTGSAFAQDVAPPPPVPAPVEEEPAVAPPPSATMPSEEEEPVEDDSTAVVPPPGGAGVTTEAVSGEPSDLPYYIPQGAERLPQQEAPVAPPQPPPPAMKIGLAPLFRVHVPTDLLFTTYVEVGATIRFGSTGGGVGFSYMPRGIGANSFAVGYETPTLLGIPFYEGPVTVAFVPRGYIQGEVFPDAELVSTNAGFVPSVQVAGCQGVPWFFNLGPHLTGHILAPLASGGDPIVFASLGVAVETGVMFF